MLLLLFCDVLLVVEVIIVFGNVDVDVVVNVVVCGYVVGVAVDAVGVDSVVGVVGVTMKGSTTDA